MGTFNPNSINKEILDKAVRNGRISDYYLDSDTLIKEVAMENGGYILKMVVYLPGTKKEHAQADYYYDSNGRFTHHKIHNF